MASGLLLGSIAVLLLGVANGKDSRQEHSLLPNVKVGDRFAFEFKSTSEVGGSAAAYSARFELSVASLEPKGTITFHTEQKNAEFSMAGQVQKIPDSKTTSKFKVTGEVLTLDPPAATPEQARFSRLMQIVVPEGTASVGKTWTWSSEPTELNGKIGLEGKGQCVAFEQRDGVPCAKLRLTARETTGEKPASSTIEVWIALKDGLPVETILRFEDAPFAPGITGSMHGVNKRVEK